MLPSPATRTAKAWSLAAPALLLAFGVLLWSGDGAATREDKTILLDTRVTTLGRKFSYPTQAPPRVTAAIVAMQPGEETGWHKHDVPMFGYMLEGEITVDYGAEGRRVYRKGDALIEAIDLAHNGRNTGAGLARILAVFMGAEGVPNTVMAPVAPQ